MKKTRKLAWLALVIALLALGGIAAGETPFVTRASISFYEGALEWYAPGTRMDITFGENEIPTGSATYVSTGEVYSIAIKDARAQNPHWSLTVGMSSFTGMVDGDPVSFDAVISLAGAQGNDTQIEATQLLLIASPTAGPTAMTVSPSKRGVFSLSWAGEQVQLLLGDAAAQTVMDIDYQAMLTWTLVNGA